jgi:transposase
LNVEVVYLPTRSPELNPIELIFHILTAWVHSFRSFRYRMAGGPCWKIVKEKTKRVLFDEMDYALILCIYVHSGY